MNTPLLFTLKSPKMKNILLFATILTGGTSSNAQSRPVPDYDLLSFAKNYMTAYNQQDRDALAEMYTEFASRIDENGKKLTGANQIGDYFARQFSNENTTLIFREPNVYWSSDQQIFVSTGIYEIYGSTIVYDIKINTTGTYTNEMVKYNGKWKIAKSVLTPLVKVLVHHEVEDVDQWKSGFEWGQPMRLAAGEISSEYGTLHDNPNTVYIISEWTSLEAFQTFFANPDLEKAMQQAGVIGKPAILILDRE
jgi:quinol monooxygenase YgiN/ketosteroid isomerase-like protein